MLTPEDFGLSDRHYRIQGHQLVEAMPDRCPAGHVLGKNNILLSNHPCTSCTGSSHRNMEMPRMRRLLDLAGLCRSSGVARVGRNRDVSRRQPD